MYPLSYSSMLPIVFLASFVSWVCFNHKPVRGDYAALAYSFAFVVLYLVVDQCVTTTTNSPLLFSSTLASTYAIFTLLFTAAYRLSPFHPLAQFPGPLVWRMSSLILAYISFNGRRHLILDRLHDTYGPFVRIGPDVLSISSPSASALYSSYAMEKSEAYTVPGRQSSVALFFKQKTKALHSDRKRIWSPAFSGAGISAFLPPLERRTWELLRCILDRRDTSGEVNLHTCLCHWAYDFMGDMVFGGCNDLQMMKNGDPENMIEGGKKAMIVQDSIGQTPWLMDIIWHIPAGKHMHRLQAVAISMMQNRIKAKDNTTLRDLSSYLLDGDSRTNVELSHADLNLDALVAIQGGSDGISTTVTLVFYFLLCEPRYYGRLQEELDRAFPQGTGHLNTDTLADLPFLNAVIHESLRLGSPSFLPRIVPKGGITLDGRFIPEGTIAANAAYSQQISPENFYPEPLNFRPERWLEGELGNATITRKAALASFSSGPHMCIAKSFAYQEMRYVIARVVLLLDMHLPHGFDKSGFRDGILVARTSVLEKPLSVVVTKRVGVEWKEFE